MRPIVYVALTALIVAACAHGVDDPVPVDDPPAPMPTTSAHDPYELETVADPEPCSRRSRVVIDGVTFDVPLPCVPLPSRDLGDPQP